MTETVALGSNVMDARRRLSWQSREALRASRRRFAPVTKLRTADWARKYRYLAGGLKPGLYDFDEQPAIEGVLDAFDDSAVREIWVRKSSQFGYTQGVELNVIGVTVHLNPCPILVLFPKDNAHKRWSREKLTPQVRASPVLAKRIDIETRGPHNTQDYKEFPNGFLQLVGSNSPANMKSTDAPIVIVSEPDDTSKSVGGAQASQGDAITIGRERTKSYGDEAKLLVGGTPTVFELSPIDAGYEGSDRRRFYVDCPHCGHLQFFRWEQVRWQKDATVPHPIYGRHRPDTARYHCEACDDAWSSVRKNMLIRQAARRPDRGWIATSQFTGRAGFHIDEMMSVMKGSYLEMMAAKFLEAAKALKDGSDAKMRSFNNNQLGLTFKPASDAPEIDALKERARAEVYEAWTVPEGGLVVTGFVDVQRGGATKEPRLELLLRAFGREQESWLVTFSVVLGNPLEPATWDALKKVLTTPIRHASGASLGISCLGIDAGDGMTMDAVLRFVSSCKLPGVYATKGAKDPRRQIYSVPKAIDLDSTDRAARYGLKLWMIGTHVAKDQIAGRIKLQGDGPRRMHVHAKLRDDYFPQLMSEVKVNDVWTLKANKANEALDCEVGALWGSYKLGLHNYTDHDWGQLEARVRQPDLLRTPEANRQAVSVWSPYRPSAPAPARPAQPFKGFGRGDD